MSRVSYGDTVKIQYVCKYCDGTIVSTESKQFTIGNRQVIKGLEQSVLGMNPGKSKTVKIPSYKAYGLYSKYNVKVINKSQFSDNFNLKIGQKVTFNLPDGQKSSGTIIRVSEWGATVDTNHPLAGKEMIYEIHLMEIM